VEEVFRGLVWYAALLFSLTVHEAAHAWSALLGGDPTAHRGGQVSLDPRPHIRREPVGTVWVPLLSYAFGGWMIGWASTPYDPRWAHAHPRRAGWMSLAGPAANLCLAILAGVAIRVGLEAGLFQLPTGAFGGFANVVTAPGHGAAAALAFFLGVLFALNLLLFAFNLLPVPPLDGSGVIALLLPRAAARRVQAVLQHPRLAWLGLLAAWLLIGRVFRSVYPPALSLLYGASP
jgi:Zn-dependent protease